MLSSVYDFGTLNSGLYYGNGYSNSYRAGGSGGTYKRNPSVSTINSQTKISSNNYNNDFADIQSLLADGEVLQAYEQLNAMDDKLKAYYDNTNIYYDDSTITNQVRNSFTSVNNQTFEQAANLDSEFMYQFKKSIPFVSWFMADCSQEEFNALKNGTTMSEKAKHRGNTGAALGGAVAGAGMGALASVIGASTVASITGTGIALAAGPVGWLALAGAAVYGLFRYSQNKVKD